MNEKASVSRELDAKHKKILEGLLKLPENKLCADCMSKGPRWASVNLGIFICMQCSGIHRSLGVHISKVRSATLDTWLPEQVAFIQTMGNEKANSYWEAELPPNYDRVGIENFIRAKYEDKRWIPRNSTLRSPSHYQEERVSEYKEKSNDRHVHESSDKAESLGEHNSHPHHDTKKNALVVPKLPTPVSSGFKIQPVMPKTASQRSPQTAPTTVDTLSSQPPKVDNPTNFFDMLSMEDTNQKGSQSSSVDDNSWANFQSIEAQSVIDEKDRTSSAGIMSKSTSGVEDLFEDASPVTPPLAPESSEAKTNTEVNSAASDNGSRRDAHSKSQSASGIEDLFKDSTSVVTPPAPEKSQEKATVKSQANIKDNILNLFDKSNMVSPFAVHQQQLAFLSQQQALMMAATKSGGAPPKFTGTNQQPHSTNSNLTNGDFPAQIWPNFGYQMPGITSPGVQKDADKFSQAGNILPSPTMIYSHYPTLSTQSVGLAAPVSEASTTEASKPSSSSSTSSSDFDFSSLTQGLFSKH